jgi:hypothetical protein
VVILHGIRATSHKTSSWLHYRREAHYDELPSLEGTSTSYSSGAQLQGHLDGSSVASDKKISIKPAGDKTDVTQVVNPEYVQWNTLEQQVLGFLLTSMTKDCMAQVASCSTPKEVRTLLEQTYTSCSKARVVNTRMALATTQKRSMTISEYIAKMKSLADDMASVGKALEDEELFSYMMAELDFEYNPIVSAMVAHVEPISVGELYAQLLSFEARWELTQGGQQALVNAARRGRGGGPGPNNRGCGCCCGGGRGHGFLAAEVVSPVELLQEKGET